MDLESASEASISTPNFPRKYPTNANHTWYIRAPSNYGIWADFHKFDVWSRDGCEKDFVAVYEGNSLSTLSEVGRYCNNAAKTPGAFLSLKRNLKVVFFTHIKHSSLGTGFELKLKRSMCFSRKLCLCPLPGI